MKIKWADPWEAPGTGFWLIASAQWMLELEFLKPFLSPAASTLDWLYIGAASSH